MDSKDTKYLIIGEAFFPEEFIINDLAKQWEKDGLKFEVLTRAPSYPFGKVFKGYRNRIYQKELWGEVLIHRFPVIQGYTKSTFIKVTNYASFVLFGTIIALFIGRKYNKVFIYHTGPLSLAVPGIIISKIYKIPVTIWSFDLWPATIYAYGFKKTRIRSWLLDHFVSFIYKNCHNIIVSSKGFIPEVQKYAGNKEIQFAPNWPQTFNINNEPSNIKLNKDFIHFTFAGNVGKVQDLENVILGFEKASLDKVQLNIFGDGSELETIKKLVAERQIKNIYLHGRIPASQINDVLDQSNVLIISLVPDPVMELTVPLKFQTYLLASRPVFAIMRGEVMKLVHDHNLGKIADPLKIDEISAGFRDFINNPPDMEQIRTNSKYLLANYYNRDKIIEKLTSVFLS